MEKKIFAFEDNIQSVAAFERLNFIISVDDATNGVFYVEADLTDYGWMSVLGVLQECDKVGLEPYFEFNGQLMTLQGAIEFANIKATEEEYEEHLKKQLPSCM